MLETNVPARLDRLPWSRWHVMVVVAGVTWLLDGMVGMLAGALSGILKNPKTLGLTDATLGLSSTILPVRLCGGRACFRLRH